MPEKTEIQKRVDMLKGMDTKNLIAVIEQAEKSYEDAQLAEADYRCGIAGYLASGTNDCQEVKMRLAELSTCVPVDPVTNKAMTAVAKEAWLTKQRKDDLGLAAMIDKQFVVAFNIEKLRITTEMAKKKMDRMRAVLELKIAQINFLGARSVIAGMNITIKLRLIKLPFFANWARS